MKNVVRIVAIASASGLVILGAVAPASAAICKNGTYSSATGRGACSWNGGVSDWQDPSRPYSKKNSLGYDSGSGWGGNSSSKGFGDFYDDGYSNSYGNGYGRNNGRGSNSLGGGSLSNSLRGNSFGGSSLGGSSLGGSSFDNGW